MKVESEKVGLKLNLQKTKIMASGPTTSWEIDGETVETVSDFIFLGFKITADGDCSHEIKRPLLHGRKVMTNLDSIFKSRDITLPTNVRLIKAMFFFCVHVWMWELDSEEGWAPKNWCLWTVVLEKTLESPLDCKEIQPVHSEGNQPWYFFGRNDAKAETPVLWPPHANSWLIGKRFWCWDGLGARGEGDDRGWDSWMASLTRWTWVWVNSGRPGMLRFMGLQRVIHDWETDLIWFIFDKGDKDIQWIKDNLFNKCWENWSTICKRMKLEHFLTPYTKIDSKWIKVLNVRPETIKLLEKNIGKTRSNINHSRMLYDSPPRILEIKAKINKWDLIKLKSFCTTKETIIKVKGQP